MSPFFKQAYHALMVFLVLVLVGGIASFPFLSICKKFMPEFPATIIGVLVALTAQAITASFLPPPPNHDSDQS